MFFTSRNLKLTTLQAMLTTSLLINVPHVFAQEDSVVDSEQLRERMLRQKHKEELNNAQSKKIAVTLSERDLSVFTSDYYDKYVFTITNQQGFNEEVDNNYGSLNISALNLPYDGRYEYEILAIRFTDELIADVQNNGRERGGLTTIAVSSKISGHFMVKDGFIEVQKMVAEPKAGKLPGRPQ